MKLLYAALLALLAFPALSQTDTVFQDTNGNVFSSLPNGFEVVDTVTEKTDTLTGVSNDVTDALSFEMEFQNDLFILTTYLDNGTIFSKDTVTNKMYNEYFLDYQLVSTSGGGEAILNINGVNVDTTSMLDSNGMGLPNPFKTGSEILTKNDIFTWSCDRYGQNAQAKYKVHYDIYRLQVTYVVDSVNTGTDTNTVSLNESKVDFSVYPNPVANTLQFGAVMNGAEYSLYSLNGQLIRQGTLSRQRLNVSALREGIYLLEVVKDGEVMRSRFLKE